MENLHVIVSAGDDCWNIEVKTFNESATLVMFEMDMFQDDDLKELMYATFGKLYKIEHIDTPTQEYHEFKLILNKV